MARQMKEETKIRFFAQRAGAALGLEKNRFFQDGKGLCRTPLFAKRHFARRLKMNHDLPAEVWLIINGVPQWRVE